MNLVVSQPLCFATAICKAGTLCCSSGLSNWCAALPAFWEGKELDLHRGLGVRWSPKAQSTGSGASAGGAAVICKGALSPCSSQACSQVEAAWASGMKWKLMGLFCVHCWTCISSQANTRYCRGPACPLAGRMLLLL